MQIRSACAAPGPYRALPVPKRSPQECSRSTQAARDRARARRMHTECSPKRPRTLACKAAARALAPGRVRPLPVLARCPRSAESGLQLPHAQRTPRTQPALRTRTLGPCSDPARSGCPVGAACPGRTKGIPVRRSRTIARVSNSGENSFFFSLPTKLPPIFWREMLMVRVPVPSLCGQGGLGVSGQRGRPRRPGVYFRRVLRRHVPAAERTRATHAHEALVLALWVYLARGGGFA
jgi:hypothetical protein